MKPAKWEAVLRRRNGRFVKVLDRGSKYRMKKVQDKAEDKYDDGYYVEIRATKEAVK